MTTPGVYLNTVTASQGISDPGAREAFQEGVDADLATELKGEKLDHPGSIDAESLKSAHPFPDGDVPPTKDEAPPADPNEVWWDSDDDPANPLNWSFAKKWGNLGLVSFITFIT
jgi:hypothetical protein